SSSAQIDTGVNDDRIVLPGYCKVLGSIAAVDRTAPAIQFELDLPTIWNRKLLMLGGGGFNGTVPNTAGNVPAGPYDRPVPLARGYAVVRSDSGHQASKTPQAPLKPGMDASFALNGEALRNYTGEALKKTHDAALYLIRMRYGVRPAKAYFAGGSTGGREACEVGQRWPDEWNGSIACYPAWSHGSRVWRVGRALASGVPHYPGYNLYGSDLGIVRDSPVQPFVIALALGTVPPRASLLAGESPAVSVFWDQWVRFVFASEPNFDALNLDPVT